MIDKPILYSFRRCPYAIRARMGLAYAGITYEHREVVLKNKPDEMLELSPKGTVPVLLIEQNGKDKVLEESLDILVWAVGENDPEGWMDYSDEDLSVMAALIEKNDIDFKNHLDHYKYADRYPEFSQAEYLDRCLPFLEILEERLKQSTYLFGNTLSYADIAIVSFIRQFSKVDEAWFSSAAYPKLKLWLSGIINSPLFLSIMHKYKPWGSDQ